MQQITMTGSGKGFITTRGSSTEEVGMDAPFFDSRGLFKGDNLVPPLHPRCYCAIVYQEMEKAENRLIGNKIPDNIDFYNVPGVYGDLDNSVFGNNNRIDRLFSVADFKTGNKDMRMYIRDKLSGQAINLEQKREKLNELIVSKTVSDRLRVEKQNEHIPGTKERARRLAREEKGRESSEFFEGIDVPGLVHKKGFNEVFEFFEHKVSQYKSFDDFIGRVYNIGKGRYVKTHRVKIEYSKKGMHLYPVKDWQ